MKIDDKAEMKELENKVTSSGLYVSTILSFFNLTCDPDINKVKLFNGKINLFSMKPIEKGDQVS